MAAPSARPRLPGVNTQTHLLLAAAALGRRATPTEQRAILAGALAPDLSIFALVGFAALSGVSGEAVWDRLYWSEPWQTLSAISNSVPLWGAAFALSLSLRRRAPALFCAAALLHLAFDLPLHAEDAHRHFWPFSDWRFHSPVSYWDPRHHGRIASLAEAAGGLAFVCILWRRHQNRGVRALLAVTALAYAGVPLFWIATLGG